MARLTLIFLGIFGLASGLGEHQVLAGGYQALSDFYYWQRNVSG